jgi:uncharacterized protein YbjQ (UPF0145 family)
MILTTSNSIEDYKILGYRGIVSGIAVNSQKMTMTFNMEKYYEGISESVFEIKAKAFEKLTENADKLDANAVYSICIYTNISNNYRGRSIYYSSKTSKKTKVLYTP